MPRNVYVQLECLHCGAKSVMQKTDWKQKSVVLCSKSSCRQVVVKFGHELTRPRTIEGKQDHEKASYRSDNPRNRVPSQKGIESAASELLVKRLSLDDDLDDVTKKVKPNHDEEWMHSPDFNPGIRFTTDGHGLLRPEPGISYSGPQKGGATCDITNPIFGERGKPTKNAMGGRVASEVATGLKLLNAKKYEEGSRDYYEWCHLHADCLGGKCEAGNLVAAHYAVNTWMLAIEQALLGKTEYQTRVTAYCLHQDVADFIKYEVLKKGNVVYTTVIDGQISRFSSSDYYRVQSQVRQSLV